VDAKTTATLYFERLLNEYDLSDSYRQRGLILLRLDGSGQIAERRSAYLD
jgi:hypothetical protein